MLQNVLNGIKFILQLSLESGKELFVKSSKTIFGNSQISCIVFKDGVGADKNCKYNSEAHLYKDKYKNTFSHTESFNMCIVVKVSEMTHKHQGCRELNDII